MANSELHNGMLLKHNEYRIERTLGQGGFGITYKAEQVSLGRKVAIKEFFMKELCERDEGTSHVTLGSAGSRETVTRYREKFLKEARNIAKLNHPNIVRVIDVFEENGTAYYVMEYAVNGSLADKVRSESYLSESVATRYILQVAEALDYVHQRKMNHLDVKPANIMLNEKDESVLIDFGLSKQYDATTGNQTSTTPVGISEGYAPMEQYKQGGVGIFSPETDIYALGATFFKLLTGATPPSASDVNEDGLPIEKLSAKGISERAISVISKAMEPRKKDRMKDIRTFIDGLKGNTPINNNARKSEKPQVTPTAKVHGTKPAEKDDTILKNNTPKPAVPIKEKPTQPAYSDGHSSKKIWLWIAVGVIVIGGVLLGRGSCGNSRFSEVADTDTVAAVIDSMAVEEEIYYEEEPQSEPTGYLNSHGYVDLGLSVKWATCNVGASSPSDYGGYYAWGETSTKSRYDWDNCFDCIDSNNWGEDSAWRTYKLGGQTRIMPSSGHDTARENWNGTWRMPTVAEFDELIDKCKWTWTSQGGHNGYKVTGPNGNSIFLPAAGWRYGTGTDYVGETGYYWSSTLSTSYSLDARGLYFGSSNHNTSDYDRGRGRSVRPVTD